MQKKSGEITLFGKKIETLTPVTAANLGIGMIYQDPHVIETISSRDNIYTGQCVTNRLGILKQNMVEFARILLLDPRIIIFDEIASKLNPGEMKTVYRIIREFRNKGVGIIYISHDMDEILRLAYRMTILRDGYRTGTELVKELDKYRLFELTYSYVLDHESLQCDNSQVLLLRNYIESLLHHLPIGAVLLDEAFEPVVVNYSALTLLSIEGETPDTLESLFNGLPGDVSEALARQITSRSECTFEDVLVKDTQIVELHSFSFDEPYYGHHRQPPFIFPYKYEENRFNQFI